MNPFPTSPWPVPVPSPWPAPPTPDPRGMTPVGTVLPYAGLLADTDADGAALAAIRANLASAGWLFCDGQAYSRDDYGALFGVIGTSFGASDANHFNVPDLRGRFVRGVNGGATSGGGADGASPPDPQAGMRVAPTKDATDHPGIQGAADGATGDHVGSAQADCFQGHEHLYTSTRMGEATAQAGSELPLLMQEPDQPTTSDVEQSGDDGEPRTGPETRPINLALNFLIRYA